MAKRNNFKRMRKVADIAEHNRKYALQQDVNKCPEIPGHTVTDMHGGLKFVEPEPKPTAPTLGQLFSFCK